MIEWNYADDNTDILVVPNGVVIRSIESHPQSKLIVSQSMVFVAMEPKDLEKFLVTIETIDDVKSEH